MRHKNLYSVTIFKKFWIFDKILPFFARFFKNIFCFEMKFPEIWSSTGILFHSDWLEEKTQLFFLLFNKRILVFLNFKHYYSDLESIIVVKSNPFLVSGGHRAVEYPSNRWKIDGKFFEGERRKWMVYVKIICSNHRFTTLRNQLQSNRFNFYMLKLHRPPPRLFCWCLWMKFFGKINLECLESFLLEMNIEWWGWDYSSWWILTEWLISVIHFIVVDF